MKNERLQQEMMRPRQWFDMIETETADEFYIYDVIGSDMWGEGLRAIDFINQVKNSKKQNIDIHINSPGGDVFDGISIYHALQESKKNIRTIVDGIAASSASIIFMAGKQREMPTGSMLMIHKAWTITIGNDKDMIQAADRLKIVDGQLAKIYTESSGYSEKKITEMLDAETYMDGKEAVKKGFATEEVEGVKIAALKWDRNILPGMPDSFNKLQNALEKRDLESVLCDAGYSRSEAKRIAAGPRDAKKEESEILEALAKNILIFKQQ